ncbi:hypothetical protein RhiLY_00251 [Ceratobasidium sp. AG-Ba]|nr:hypothetical protein RhiLY_00251 [Ceratobasidium sp. AG-Ba]
MPDWIGISTLVRNVTNTFSMGQHPVPSAPPPLSSEIVPIDVQALLKDVNDVLLQSSDMVKNNERLLPPMEYEILKAQHREFHWQFVREDKNRRELQAELLRPSRPLSEIQESKEALQVRVTRLRDDVEEYQEAVLTASRRANTIPMMPFPDEAPVQEASSSSIESPPVDNPSDTRSSPSTSSSLAPSLALNRTVSSTSLSLNTPRPSFARQNLGLMIKPNIPSIPGMFIGRTHPNSIMSVAYVPIGSTGESVPRPSDPSKKLYTRDVAAIYGKECISIDDPTLYELGEDELAIDDARLFEVYDMLGKRMAHALSKCHKTGLQAECKQSSQVQVKRGARANSKIHGKAPRRSDFRFDVPTHNWGQLHDTESTAAPQVHTSMSELSMPNLGASITSSPRPTGARLDSSTINLPARVPHPPGSLN